MTPKYVQEHPVAYSMPQFLCASSYGEGWPAEKVPNSPSVLVVQECCIEVDAWTKQPMNFYNYKQKNGLSQWLVYPLMPIVLAS